MFMFTFLLAGGLRHYSMSYASRSFQLSYSSRYFMFVSFLFGGSVANPSQAAITFVLCLYFVLYPLYHSYHARTEVSSSE